MHHALEQLVVLVARLQVVVGNPRAEMVDVVETDVPGEPRHHPPGGQVAGGLERRVRVRPRAVAPAAGPQLVILVPSIGMLAMIVWMTFFTPIWKMRADDVHDAGSGI